MALPPNPDPAHSSGPSELPSSYRNPWLTLGENLQAVAADVRLRLCELRRRNAEGCLWRPGWWPRDLAPLFWPLLLALALGLVLVAGFGRALAPSGAPLPEAASTSEITSARSEAPIAEPVTETLTPQPADRPEAAADADPPAGPTAPAAASDQPESDVPRPVDVDPLVELLQRPEAAGLLIRATMQPDQLTLVLQVTTGFETLPLSSRQRHAEQWKQWATDLGYDHLELRDSRSGLLARDALVGSGMIVLIEQPQP